MLILLKVKLPQEIKMGPNHLIAIRSEDATDEDYDDAIVYFKYLVGKKNWCYDA